MIGQILGAITGLGALFGKGSQASAEGRAREAELLQRQDALRQSQYQTQQGAQMNAGQLDLQRKGFEEDARSGRAKQQTIANLLMNFKPTQVSVPGIQNATVSGGMQLGEDGRLALMELIKQAREAQLSKDQFSGGQVLTPPALSAMPKASGWEKAGSIGGILGAVAGGLAPYLQGKHTPVEDEGEAVNPGLYGRVRF